MLRHFMALRHAADIDFFALRCHAMFDAAAFHY